MRHGEAVPPACASRVVSHTLAMAATTQHDPAQAAVAASSGGRFAAWPIFAAIAALALLMFVMRLAAPPNLLAQSQRPPAAYVLDVVKNGNWLCQRDLDGSVASKPPLWVWLSALATLATGRISSFTLYLPGAVAALGTAWLVVAAGVRFFGPRAAFYAGLATLLHTAGFKAMGLARTDGVFAFTVTVTALLAFRSATLGRGWTWFWLAAAAATLTKGPLGLLFGGCGLLAWIWERRSDRSIALRGSHRLGVALFLVIVGGWFYLSYRQLGQPLLDKMIGVELLGHLATNHRGALPLTQFLEAPFYYVTRTSPWWLAGCVGLWRIWKHPATDPRERRFERFLFCWFVGGLFALGIAAHQQANLNWPLLPAAALIAGREVDRLAQRWSRRSFDAVIATLIALMVASYAVGYFVITPMEPVIKRTIAVRELAGRFESLAGPEFPLTHVGDTTGLQIYLNTSRPSVSAQRAVRLLRGPDAAFVAVRDFPVLERLRQPDDRPWFTLLRDETGSDLTTRIVGNRSTLTESNELTFSYGALTVRLDGSRLVSATERELRARAVAAHASVTVNNESNGPRSLRIVIERPGQITDHSKLLNAGETWVVTAGATVISSPSTVEPRSRSASSSHGESLAARIQRRHPD